MSTRLPDTMRYGPALYVEIIGKPVTQGSMHSYGKGRPMVHSNKDTLMPWREALITGFRLEMARATERFHAAWPLEGPIAVSAAYTVTKPASAPKRRRIWPVTRSSGDLDKLQRATFDALTMSGAIRDDSQIIDVDAAKTFPHEGWRALDVPGLILALYTVGEKVEWPS